MLLNTTVDYNKTFYYHKFMLALVQIEQLYSVLILKIKGEQDVLILWQLAEVPKPDVSNP